MDYPTQDRSTQGPLIPGPLNPGPLKPESSILTMGPLYLPPWKEVLNNIAGELHMVVVRNEISGDIHYSGSSTDWALGL